MSDLAHIQARGEEAMLKKTLSDIAEEFPLICSDQSCLFQIYHDVNYELLTESERECIMEAIANIRAKEQDVNRRCLEYMTRHKS